MKMIDTTCPNCGSQFKIDSEAKSAICEHCGKTVLIDDEIQHVQYDNAEEAGYMFEKGRQRAIAEAKQSSQQNNASRGTYQQKPGQNRVYESRPNPRSASGQGSGKSYTWLWVLGWICFFPAPIMVLIWRKKNTWDIKVKIAVTVVFWLLFILIGSSGDGSSTTTDATSSDSKAIVQDETTDKSKKKPEVETGDSSNIQKNEAKSDTLYANAETVDMMSGSGKNKIGTITVCHADQADCTEAALSDWYMNFVKKNSDSKFHVIIYNDKPTHGVYANGMDFIQKDIELKKEEDGTYACGDDAGSTYYTVSEDGTLVVFSTMADASIIHDVESKIDAIIPDEYKGGKNYDVDIAGPEGALDCNLTLINPDFATADCQSIALDLAKSIQDLGLGIGYFNISFQSDDYTMNALSSVDLSEQDASEITTKSF